MAMRWGLVVHDRIIVLLGLANTLDARTRQRYIFVCGRILFKSAITWVNGLTVQTRLWTTTATRFAQTDGDQPQNVMIYTSNPFNRDSA